MHPLLTRAKVQVLRQAGHTFADIARLTGVSDRAARRIALEPTVENADDEAEIARRRIGRPSVVEQYRGFVTSQLDENPELQSLEILRRARDKGYQGKKSAMYELIASVRGPKTDFHMRFEGLPGEFSQHDFGEVEVKYTDGTKEKVKFFASRLKYSRYAAVSLVPNETAETLVRTTLDHFVVFGGVPLCAVFDRPRTVALAWKADGTITEWNPTFAYAAMEIGFTAEVCWAYSPQQKGAVEAIVKWVKNSFFKQRKFLDREDLQRQLDEWLTEVNTTRASRATKVIPEARRQEELPRLRRPKVAPDQLAIRQPVSVGPTATIAFEGHTYELDPNTAGFTGTVYIYRDTVRFEVGGKKVTYPRGGAPRPKSDPVIRAARLAAVHGARGKKYLKRQQILDIGPAAQTFLTAVVHADQRGWSRIVDYLHDLLQQFGPDTLHRALRATLDVGRGDLEYVRQVLGQNAPPLFSDLDA
jgi:transposase